MLDKFQMIDSIIVQMDKIFDQRGVERAATVIDVIKKLNILRDGLKKEDEAHERDMNELRNAMGAVEVPVDEFFGNEGDKP